MTSNRLAPADLKSTPRLAQASLQRRSACAFQSGQIGLSSPAVGCAVHKGASLSSILRSKVCSEYGGYLTPGSIRVLWYRTPRALVNVSKLNLPWYLPIPELPTPPKGSSGKNGWIVHSLMHALPDSVASRMRSATLRSSANTYVPSGGGWLLIDWMTFSIESTSITGRIGPNTSSCMIGESGAGSTR